MVRLILFSTLVFDVIHIYGFGHLSNLDRNVISTSSRLGILKAVSLDEADDEVTKNAACLNFVGIVRSESSAAPLASPEKILEFFQIDENRNALVTAGNRKPCTESIPSPELLQLWRKKAVMNGGTKPDESDVVLQVTTGGMHFPGLTLKSVVLIGSKLVPSTASNNFPEFEFVLIDDEQQVEGAKPIVWIFNQLTGASKKKVAKKDDGPLSITRVSAKPPPDENGIIFFIDGHLKVSVKFPSFLLKILPMKKEKAEEQGSQAIQQAVEKESKEGLLAFRDLYEAWITA